MIRANIFKIIYAINKRQLELEGMQQHRHIVRLADSKIKAPAREVGANAP